MNLGFDKLSNLLEDYDQIDKVKKDLVNRISKEAKTLWKYGPITSIEFVRQGRRSVPSKVEICCYNKETHDDMIVILEYGKNPESDLLLRVLAIDGVRLF